ncbi:hypothetical protein [Afifella pfennigii]|uniref:hypothetical protein n=1 Tax=Afifella pfennigii TaxID=209897 RepID=UPI0006897492|nr:hypothetical protein [Afifella pfennigii]
MIRRATVSVVMSLAFAASSMPALAEMPRAPAALGSNLSSVPLVQVGERRIAPNAVGGGVSVYSGPAYRSASYYGGRRYYGRHYYRPRYYGRGYYRPYYRPYYRGYGYGGDVAAGIVGLGFGLALGSAIAQPRYYHYRPAPAYGGVCRPWTPTWYARCSRFKTFNPRTGYYFYKPGKQRFCPC